MTVRELDSAPSALPQYARAAAAAVPGLSRLPFIGPGGKDVPDLELVLRDQAIDREHVAAYGKVCGFTLRSALPATYPHMLAFPLHMALMTDPSFPFGAIGLVHIENRIAQHRPIDVSELLTLNVKATPLEPHPKGRQFSVVTEVRAGDELVWDSTSTNLRRGDGAGEGKPRGARPERPPTSSTWTLPGDLGRRYGAVSGDRNPIHMHDLTAKAFGFPRAIAHGMWTKARCVAALESRLPGAFAVEVAFRQPILLPAKVAFGSVDEGPEIRFGVHSARGGKPHLEGTVTPL